MCNMHKHVIKANCVQVFVTAKLIQLSFIMELLFVSLQYH